MTLTDARTAPTRKSPGRKESQAGKLVERRLRVVENIYEDVGGRCAAANGIEQMFKQFKSQRFFRRLKYST